MRVAALALALLVSARALADVPDAGIVVRYDCGEGGERGVEVDGGWWIPRQRADFLKCVLVATQEHRDELLKQNEELRAQPPGPGWSTWAIVCGLVAVASFVGGLMVRK